MSRRRGWVGGWLRNRVEFSLAVVLGKLVVLLPKSAASALCRGLGSLLFRVLGSRRELARKNLCAAFPEFADDPKRCDQVLRRSLQHLVTVPVELLRLGAALRKQSPRQIVEVCGGEHLETIRERGGACIYLTGHAGNWEVGGALCEPLGYGLTSVGRALDNPLLHRWLHEIRCAFGQKVAEKDGASRQILRQLRGGQKIGLLLDQHAGRHGIRVPFLGRMASTHSSAAHFARRMNVPLLPGFAMREGGLLKFRLQVFPPLWPDPSLPEAEDHYRMTRYYSACLESVIREYPDQYLWCHRRWRDGGTEPEPEWLERYPG